MPPMMCPYLWSLLKTVRLTPARHKNTMPIIVATVTNPNVAVTARRSVQLFFAAGYIRIGISGSHGPKTNMMKSAHAVVAFLALS